MKNNRVSLQFAGQVAITVAALFIELLFLDGDCYYLCTVNFIVRKGLYSHAVSVGPLVRGRLI